VAFTHGKESKLTLNSGVLGAGGTVETLTNIGFNPTKDAPETTTMGDDSRDFVEGLRNCTITLSGRFDPTVTNGSDHILWNAYASTSLVSFSYNPVGGSVGTSNPIYSGSCWVTDYSVDDPFDDVITWSATLQVSGAVARHTS